MYFTNYSLITWRETSPYRTFVFHRKKMKNRLIPEDVGLKKNERLKSTKAIDALFSKGKFITYGRLILKYSLHDLLENQPSLKVGVTVSSKKFKKATDRNFVKRIMRESFRQRKQMFKSSLSPYMQGMNMMFIYNHPERPRLNDLLNDMDGILKKFEYKMTRNEQA
jgi:ribonuclease P protein component